MNKTKKEGWTCRFCNEIFNTRSKRDFHYKNIHPIERKKGVNQYTKAKQENKNIVISENTRKKLSNIWKGKKHKEESKLKISESQKKNYQNKSRWYIQGRTQMSYAESYFKGIFDTFENIPEHNYKVLRFWLDFAWPDKKIYFEVDGEQHYDPKSIIRDNNRKIELEKLGWKCIGKIRWSKYQKLSFKEKKEIIDELKNY